MLKTLVENKSALCSFMALTRIQHYLATSAAAVPFYLLPLFHTNTQSHHHLWHHLLARPLTLVLTINISIYIFAFLWSGTFALLLRFVFNLKTSSYINFAWRILWHFYYCFHTYHYEFVKPYLTVRLFYVVHSVSTVLKLRLYNQCWYYWMFCFETLRIEMCIAQDLTKIGGQKRSLWDK